MNLDVALEVALEIMLEASCLTPDNSRHGFGV